MKMTHVLRTLHDGILVGVGTVVADNPSLNARLAEGMKRWHLLPCCSVAVEFLTVCWSFRPRRQQPPANYH